MLQGQLYVAEGQWSFVSGSLPTRVEFKICWLGVLLDQPAVLVGEQTLPAERLPCMCACWVRSQGLRCCAVPCCAHNKWYAAVVLIDGHSETGCRVALRCVLA